MNGTGFTAVLPMMILSRSMMKKCIVNTKSMDQVVVIGMDDCIVAENGGKLLVCRMSEEGHIKEFSGEK